MSFFSIIAKKGMKIKYYILCVFINLITFNNYSQSENYASFLIPDSLKINANSVIRNNILEVTINSIKSITTKKHSVVTVLNELGNKNIDLYEYYDNDTEIKSLSVKVYNGLGKEIKKISKNKFIDVSAVSGGTLYSDAKVMYVEYTPTTYPYTVVFESEIKSSSTGVIPRWNPIPNYFISVQKSTYIVNTPPEVILKKRETNFNDFLIEDVSTENKIHYTLYNQPAKKYEQSSLAFFNTMPSVWLALNNFTLKKVEGKSANWKEFGTWMQKKLLANKITLEEKTKLEIKSLVKNAKTDIEKARIVYNYMQDKTRYISVQVGIGGWEPITAKDVDKLGYGDCKGLSNYMKALLLTVGIESNYTIVYANRRRDIDTDFASIQGNHAILNIPNKGNDIWLECTSQTMPFGFLGSFTDDRDVLVITPEGGVIKRTPAYKNETNHQQTKATIVIDYKGNVTADLERVSKGIQYGDKFRIENKSEKDLKKHYLTNVWDYNNNLEISTIDLDNNKDDVIFTEKLAIKIDEYATVNTNDLLLRLNVFNKYSNVPKRYRNRKESLQVNRGFLDEDEFIFTIPEGYLINQLPTSKKITNKFGVYNISVEKLNEKTIVYKKYFLLKEGIYPKEDYKSYRSFLKMVSKHENSRIALHKK